MSNAAAVLLPESFRGGCSFGADVVGDASISPAAAAQGYHAASWRRPRRSRAAHRWSRSLRSPPSRRLRRLRRSRRSRRGRVEVAVRRSLTLTACGGDARRAAHTRSMRSLAGELGGGRHRPRVRGRGRSRSRPRAGSGARRGVGGRAREGEREARELRATFLLGAPRCVFPGEYACFRTCVATRRRARCRSRRPARGRWRQFAGRKKSSRASRGY